jgi:pyruvate/2-oxoglutarate dehydrogenase complex dihydrolipoamide dehydrogenase (E3) component
MFDVIVIGGGPAGVVAALRARELGANVALIERGSLGGSCVNDGCVPLRVLARAARLMRNASQFEAYGLIGTAPTIDFPQLLRQASQVIHDVHANKQLLENLRHVGITIFANAGYAHFVDENTVALADGQQLQAEKFIICAGGYSRALDFPGAEYALTFNDIWTLPELPRTAVIVGASATGCQLASILAAFGTHVTLIDRSPRILNTADELISHEITDAFRERGITIVTGLEEIERIDRLADQQYLHYRQQGQSYRQAADMVLLAVGWPANTGPLNLEAAGVQTERGYVLVDERLQTSVPYIFAAGDVTGLTMLVQSADHQARIAAENAVLGNDRTFVHKGIPFGGFTDPEYAGLGMTEAAARAEHDCAVAVVTYNELDRAVIDGRTRGSFKLIVSRSTRRILGAHVVGEQALEVVQIVAATMKMGGRVEDLARLKIAYPTFAAIVGVAARRLARELGVVPVAPHWRDLRQMQVADWEGAPRPLLEAVTCVPAE